MSDFAKQSRRESYEKTIEELGDRQREVMCCLVLEDMGAWEIAEKTCRLVHSVRPRLHELVKAGLVQEVGKRWNEATRRNETVYRAMI